MNIWFAVDNIDLLEDTPNRQNIFHGTVIVINQRNVNGEPVNKPLVIPGRRTIIIQIYHMSVGKEVMPTWAATRPLLLSNTHESITRTNTEVIAPLFKPSPTNITTLYTVLMLRQVVSAVVVGPERKTIITFDLDLFYSSALHIQQTVGNTNWVLQAGVLHIVFPAFHAWQNIRWQWH